MSPSVDGIENINPDVARRMARVEWLATHPPAYLAAALFETEERVAALEREQLAVEVARLPRPVEVGPDTATRAAADRAAVVDGYADAVRERDQLRRDRLLSELFDANSRSAHQHRLALDRLCAGLDDVIARGRRGELSMVGLVPVTALVELLDAHRPQNAAPGEGSPYGAATGSDRPGPDPVDPPAPPDGAR